jgi:hypothetical protein
MANKESEYILAGGHARGLDDNKAIFFCANKSE